jgi:hypothetical protein
MSSGSISVDHTSTNGSGRVRHVRGSFVSEGNGPRCHVRAVLSLIPAAAAAASNVAFFIRFFLSKRTCLSLTIRGSRSPGTRPELAQLRTVAQAVRTADPPAEVVVARRQK